MRFSTFFRRSDIGKMIFLTAAFSIFLTGCGGDKSAEGNRGGANRAAKDENPIAVTTAKVESREVPAYIQATGSLVADETSDIAPKAAGKIVNVSVNVGDFVGQGSVIARIDDRDARLRLVL